MADSVNVSLSDLFDAGLIHEGDLVSVTLPHQYNEGENKYTATGTMNKRGVSYGAEVFTSLSDFHQFLKLKRARELRAKGISAPKNPVAPNDSTISKTTTIEGTPLVNLSRKYHAMKQLKNLSFPPSKKKVISIPDSMEIQTLDPSMGDEEDSEQISDASIDPFNDEDMDMSPLPTHMDTHGRKIVYIDLRLFAFGAYDAHGKLLYWGPVSSGRKKCYNTNGNCSTATGYFRIFRIEGKDCISHEYPLETHGGDPMPYCMYFHGGTAMHYSTLSGFINRSAGCVRMFKADAKWLNKVFVKLGTEVIVIK